MNTNLFLLTAAAFAMTGCSTIANGKNQAVQFTTGAVEGADCLVTGGRDGALRESFQTPAEVQIRRAKTAIDVECSKDGYQTASRTVESKMEGTTGGNVVAGGFVGLGVDAMTGAMFKYPDTILLELEAINPPTVTGDPIS
jgi:hypothetical protein